MIPHHNQDAIFIKKWVFCKFGKISLMIIPKVFGRFSSLLKLWIARPRHLFRLFQLFLLLLVEQMTSFFLYHFKVHVMMSLTQYSGNICLKHSKLIKQNPLSTLKHIFIYTRVAQCFLVTRLFKLDKNWWRH